MKTNSRSANLINACNFFCDLSLSFQMLDALNCKKHIAPFKVRELKHLLSKSSLIMPTTIRKLVAYIEGVFYDNLIPLKNHYFNFIFSIFNVILIIISQSRFYYLLFSRTLHNDCNSHQQSNCNQG